MNELTEYERLISIHNRKDLIRRGKNGQAGYIKS